MITFDMLRSALLDLDPSTALDRLVRAELAVSRKTQAIYDELIGHIDSLRAMPEYTDAIEDTMDALCGWCHPDFCYKDPPEPAATTPTPLVQAHIPSTTPKNV